VDSTFNIALTIAITDLPSTHVVHLAIYFRRGPTPSSGAPSIVDDANTIPAPSWSMPTLGEDANDEIFIPAVWNGLSIVYGTLTGGILVAAD
jgi:hypothetical protein